MTENSHVLGDFTWTGWEYLGEAGIGRVDYTGEANRFTAEFDTVYEPGELVAIGYSGGREQGRMPLRSALGPVRLAVWADRSSIRADDSDLAFVDISLLSSKPDWCQTS